MVSVRRPSGVNANNPVLVDLESSGALGSEKRVQVSHTAAQKQEFLAQHSGSAPLPVPPENLGLIAEPVTGGSTRLGFGLNVNTHRQTKSGSMQRLIEPAVSFKPLGTRGLRLAPCGTG